MKKIDVPKLLIELVSVAFVGMIIAAILAVILFGFDSPHLLFQIKMLTVICDAACYIIWFVICEDIFLSGKVYKTLNRNLADFSQDNYSTFESNNSIICTNVEQGKIVIVYKRNYNALTIIDAKDITNIKSDYVKGPLGGASCTYFQFTYNNMDIRVNTYLSNKAHTLNNPEIVEGMSKADAYCAVLRNAQGNLIRA